jgi:hypothetical protein
MATSPLFGWEEPDDVDLVKDGAAAIRTLGNAIDTSMGDLLGGTTGQVLSKASNTNMDFTWVTSDDANAIQNTIVDAKGDLIAASASDVPARLAVGANGETLVADSSTSTGLRYQPPAASQPVLNSAFQVWQRGTTFTASSATTGYTADRWLGYRSVAGGTISRQTTSDTTNLPNIQYCARVARDVGNTSTATINFYNIFESVNSIPFAGKTVTLSFYARAGANYSSTTTNVLLTTGTGTDQNILSGFTGQTNAISSTVTPTTTWARYTYTATLATTATQISIGIIQNPLGTAGAADYLEITGVQLEVGSVATQFKTFSATIQGELAACQRYYYRTVATNTNGVFGMAQASAATGGWMSFQYPVSMRIAPSTIETTGTASNYAMFNSTSGLIACSSVPSLLASYSSNTNSLINVSVASGLVAGNASIFYANSTATAYLGFSAEL